MNIARIPRRGYVKESTPIEVLPNFSKALGGKVNILIKREDLLPGAGGGNKTRKLDFVMQDVVESGADTVITYANIQSNHCRLTLDWANMEGLACHLVLEERVPGSYHPRNSGNNFLYHLLGVSGITVVPGGSDMQAEVRKVAALLRSEGRKPYVVPIGASTGLGAAGYAAFALEMMSQLADMRRKIDHVIVASGSGGTQAGIVAGLVGMDANVSVLGITVGRERHAQEAMVRRIANETAELFGIKEGVPPEAVVCNGDYFPPGYSLPNDAMLEAVTLLARTEGILIDPIYTGKAMAGLIDYVRKGLFPEGSTVLFVHTGGVHALYGYTDHFWNFLNN